MSKNPTEIIDGGEISGLARASATEKKDIPPSLLDQFHHIFFERNYAGVYLTTPDGWILDCNDSFARILGYDGREEIIGLNASSLYFGTSDRNTFIDQLRTEGALTNSELRLKRKDGTPVWIIENVNLIHDKTLGSEIILGSLVDMTKRVKIEEALKEEKERFRILVEESPVGFSLSTREGVFKYLNPKFVEMFGYTLEDIPTGRQWFRKAFPDPDYRRGVIAAWFEDIALAEAGEAPIRQFDVTCKDHSKKVIQFRAVAMATGDVFVHSEDISVQKRMETQLLQAQKLEAIGTLAGGIAHDFNNLLMGIQGRVSLLSQEIEPDHLLYEHLQGIEEYVRNATALTKQLLGFARGGKYEVKTQDINRILKSSSDLFGRTRKEIRIHRKLEEGLWYVDADKSQMESVFLNLFINAWQAMPGGGDLSIVTENTLIEEHDPKLYGLTAGRFVKITISDTGTGMDESTRQRIFDPFFTTKGMGRGAGLGLASAYGIIKNHGGVITVFSQRGEGSTFQIYLPASLKTHVEKKEKTSSGIKTGSETVLLVDDEGMILDVGRLLLKKLGYRVLTAASGQEALNLYREQHDAVDLVILDMIMPGMGGGACYTRLKEINPDIKVLLSSGYSLDGQASEILDRGCNGFIQKPFDLKNLSKKIREVLEKP